LIFKLACPDILCKFCPIFKIIIKYLGGMELTTMDLSGASTERRALCSMIVTTASSKMFKSGNNNIENWSK
jgi:hypothetical protein